ncbi:MAG TPA: NfeD family protein [Candidatus Pelethosoma merdigallinarum]|nr:NfeD family protein [Candidatus Pelethosoma merdigallinarum]
MSYLWVLIIILLALAEVTTVNLTTIWFVASGLVSLILSFFIDNFLIQLGVFVILGIILLITTKSKLQALVNERREKTNLDRIVGMQGYVVEKITKRKNGAVKVDGKVWTAFADQTIPKDSDVEILAIEGVKVKVKKVGK